jgi:hypothetical protein
MHRVAHKYTKFITFATNTMSGRRKPTQRLPAFPKTCNLQSLKVPSNTALSSNGFNGMTHHKSNDNASSPGEHTVSTSRMSVDSARTIPNRAGSADTQETPDDSEQFQTPIPVKTIQVGTVGGTADSSFDGGGSRQQLYMQPKQSEDGLKKTIRDAAKGVLFSRLKFLKKENDLHYRYSTDPRTVCGVILCELDYLENPNAERFWIDSRQLIFKTHGSHRNNVIKNIQAYYKSKKVLSVYQQLIEYMCN